MPGSLDGAALAREVKRRYPELPILLTTGFSKAAESIREDFPLLRKPYGIADLRRAVAKLDLAEKARREQPNLVTYLDLQRMRASKSGTKPE
jgi:DNA-binding NtrC family response regulator